MSRCFILVPPPTLGLISHRYIHIHLLNLLDGSPYRAPPSNVITLELPPGFRVICLEHLVMTGSRLMMYVYVGDKHSGGTMEEWRVVVWDWETGKSVSRVGLWSRFSNVIFVDPGAGPFERVAQWKGDVRTGLSGRFPRRISNPVDTPPRLLGSSALRVQHAHSTGPSQKLAMVQAPTIRNTERPLASGP